MSASRSDSLSIRTLDVAALDRHLDDLATILWACVHDGGSVGFILPFDLDDARAFWANKVRPGLAGGRLVLLAAFLDDRLVGTAQLDWDMMPNQPHRADVKKLLVHPEVQRRGIARALMREIDRHALRLKRRTLVLDTRTGDKAEPLYKSMGYLVAGIIPDYCRDNATERLDPTTVMYKLLDVTDAQ